MDRVQTPLIKDAVISADERYRYALWRGEDKMLGGPFLLFIGLNPSTADAREDDPTIRRCIGFTRSFGFKNFLMLNLFAFRAVHPEQLRRPKWPDRGGPKGLENDEWLRRGAAAAEKIVLCWGTHGHLNGRDREVVELLRDNHHSDKCYCLDKTTGGFPKHPLFIKADTPLKLFRGQDAGQGRLLLA